jgi:hypothetical protein
MDMRISVFCGLVSLAIGSLQGCGAADGSMPDEGASVEEVAQESAALLPTNFVLKNFADLSKCIGVKAGTPTPRTPLIVFRCDDSANQTWTRHPTFFDHLQNKVAADRCLTTRGTGDGSLTEIFNCLDHTFEGWKMNFMFNFSGMDCFNIESKAAVGKVLSVIGGAVIDEKPVGIFNNFGGSPHPDQIWCAGPAPQF